MRSAAFRPQTEPASIVVDLPRDPNALYGAVRRRLERQIRKGTTIAVTYLDCMGRICFRSLDVNARLPPA